jgi:hypothetical protein
MEDRVESPYPLPRSGALAAAASSSVHAVAAAAAHPIIVTATSPAAQGVVTKHDLWNIQRGVIVTTNHFYNMYCSVEWVVFCLGCCYIRDLRCATYCNRLPCSEKKTYETSLKEGVGEKR